MPSWDVEQYERYKTYRDRPALDLMVQIPHDLEPKEIWDLGCGAGEHAALLALRHPEAKVHGLDGSPDMLAAARARPAKVEWIQGDIAGFAPDLPPDLIFTNAALQWLPDHKTLFPKLVSTLAPGGVFACQIPLSEREAWHRRLRDAAANGPWKAKLADARTLHRVSDADAYYDWLSPLAEVDIWSTTYLHVLSGEEPIVDWMKGSGLRPYLDLLTDPEERDAFLDVYRKSVDESFPKRVDGVTLFPFPRLFIVARRRSPLAR
jgi:trans-aconitate 2-methyltransferase